MSWTIIPEAASAPPQARRRYSWRSAVLSILFGMFFALAMLPLLDGEPADAARWGLLAGSFASLGLLVREFVVLMGTLDELQRQIHMSALAGGFGAVSVASCVIAMLGVFLDWEFRVLALAMVLQLPLATVLYYVGLHRIGARYR